VALHLFWVSFQGEGGDVTLGINYDYGDAVAYSLFHHTFAEHGFA
jgi:hypothetical protein